MCRACVLFVALSAWAGTSSAQDTLVARLRARADSLAREWRQAGALADLVDSLERGRAGEGRDTIAVGGLRIVTNPSPLPVRQAAARAWPIIDSLYGAVAADLVRRPYLIRAVDPDTAVRSSSFHAGMEVPWDLDEAAVVALLLSNVPIAPPDPALADWLGSSLRPEVRGRQDRAAVYVQLVTAPSQAARRARSSLARSRTSSTTDPAQHRSAHARGAATSTAPSCSGHCPGACSRNRLGTMRERRWCTSPSDSGGGLRIAGCWRIPRPRWPNALPRLPAPEWIPLSLAGRSEERRVGKE